jgi:hypothetical protein
MIIKRKLIKTFLLILMSSGLLHSQDYVSFSTYHDLKLLAFGDDRGNRAGTLDILFRLKLQKPQNTTGYLVYLLEVEQANIEMNLLRYGFATGYAFNALFSNDINFEITPILGLGAIHRQGVSTFSWSGSIGFDYKLSERVKISSLLQYTDRSDLKRIYNDSKVRYSFFFGLEFNLFRLHR